jgi:integrase
MGQLHRLSALAVSKLTKPGLHSDGGGLYLNVDKKTSARSWIFRFKLSGKERFMGLGGYPTISLAEARERAAEARRLKADGIDPIEAKRAKASAEQPAKVSTFAEVAADYIETRKGTWKNEKSLQRWQRFERYAVTAFGEKAVTEIDASDVEKLLKPFVGTKMETARKLREWLTGALEFARAGDDKDRHFPASWKNPARWEKHIERRIPALAKKHKTVRHHAALPWQDVPAFVTELKARDALAARALEFCILTTARTSEILMAEWTEIDGAVWTIPAHRHKMGKKTGQPHHVPLPRQAIELIKTLSVERDSIYMFPGHKRGRPLSNMAMLMLLERMGRRYAITVHGMRSTFRDWAAEETNFSRAVCEACLAHSVAENETEAAYLRSDLFKKRVELMQLWADFCYG